MEKLTPYIDKAYEIEANCVLKIVADYWGVPVDYIKECKRNRSRIIMRHESQYLMKKLIPSMPLASIGRFTGNGKPKDHATVLYACRMVEKDLTATTFKGKLAEPERVKRVAELSGLIVESLENL